MTWPPADLPIDFQNATPQENTHPDAHNATNQTINADLVPEIKRVAAIADAGPYLPLAGGTLSGNLQVSGIMQGRLSFGATSAGDVPLKLYEGSPTYFHGIGVGVNSITFYINGEVAAEVKPGGLAFNIAAIDTADLLGRIDKATAATSDSTETVITINEIVTLLLAQMKQQRDEIETLTARIEALEAKN